MSQPPPDVVDPKAANRARFELELEFVQSLANPYYLHSLAQQGILNQPAFVNFLQYLQYWKKKDYARFILYPHALHHLELLQHAQFRTDIGKDEWREYLNQKQYDHWRTWREYVPPNTVAVGPDGIAVDAIQETNANKAQ
ncbi:suppressor of hpr1 [Steccherinum ochraceum]|uniref:Mediator of RNA polymerase II transcription subunit 31 n=1 Tax=Steccherinum ochraceum TaxID=92696 RepID=A0A4R0RSD9_9APHY|nr:suppressor of hpr1 [Steccherinum ochraceum]